jgi:hypothetical protein
VLGGVPHRPRLSGRLRLARLGVVMGAFALLLAACLPPAPPPPPPTTTTTTTTLPPAVSTFCAPHTPVSPADYQQAFDGLRTVWTEWAASDGSIPVVLPDGRVLWMFGDTIVGRVLADRSIASGWRLIHNSFVLQDGACLTPLMGGARGSRTEIVPNPATNEWFWPTAGVVESNGTRLRVLLLHLRSTGSTAPFNFAVVGVELATYTLPDLSLVATTDLPLAAAPAPPYGQTTLVDGGFLYLYGSEDASYGSPFKVRLHQVARVALGSETTASAWEFAKVDPDTSAVTWSTKPVDATPMLFDPDGSGPDAATIDDGPRAPLVVTPYAGGYLGTAKTIDAFSDDVSTWFAPSPTGPWSYVGKAVTGLAGDPTASFTYGGRIVTDLPGSPPVLIWSQNHEPLSDVIANNALYRANFATPAPASLAVSGP